MQLGFDSVDREPTVVLYNRAGYHGSEIEGCRRAGGPEDPAACMRAAADALSDMRLLLHKLSLSPPYVLVGHSIGGLHMQLFARRYPSEVAGVLLIDPTPDRDVEAECLDSGIPESTCHEEMSRALWGLFPTAARAEWRGFEKSIRQVQAAPDFPDVPLTVLSAPDVLRDIDGYDMSAILLRLHRELAAESSLGQHVIVNGSSHYIQHDKPELVAEQLRRLVDLVRSQPGIHEKL